MKKSIVKRPIKPVLVVNQNGKLKTDSLVVAKVFEKEHKHIMRDIRNITESDVYQKRNQLNFRLVEYKDAKGEMRPKYEFIQEGLLILVTGWNGERALNFKILLFTESFEVAWKWICEENEALQKTVKPDQLYVALYQDGMIKVGKGIRAKNRIESHIMFAKSHSNPITDWHIEIAPKMTEKELIGFCRLHGTLHGGNEYFKNLDYDSVVNFLKGKVERKVLPNKTIKSDNIIPILPYRERRMQTV